MAENIKQEIADPEFSGFAKNYKIGKDWKVAQLTTIERRAIIGKHIEDNVKLFDTLLAIAKNKVSTSRQQFDLATALFDKVADASYTRISSALNSKVRNLRDNGGTYGNVDDIGNADSNGEGDQSPSTPTNEPYDMFELHRDEEEQSSSSYNKDQENRRERETRPVVGLVGSIKHVENPCSFCGREMTWDNIENFFWCESCEITKLGDDKNG